MIFNGTAHIFGDNIDTDVIIPARYLSTYNPSELAAHCMEDIDSGFVSRVKQGDIIVAGENFGCGSSREHAPVAIKSSGVACVVAVSFARIFYRNAINVGLPIFECNLTGSASEGDTLKINADTGEIINLTTGKAFFGAPFPEFIQEIIRAGGELNYIRKRG